MKIKVFELEFDASNLHEVAFVKEVIAGSNLNVPAEEVVTAPEKEEKPVEEEETAYSPVPQATKEMQDLVISLIKTGTLSREDVQTIFNEFGGTSLMKIAPTKFALLKQRLTTYNN